MGLAAAGLGWRGSALAGVVPEPTPPMLAEPGTAFMPSVVDDIARKLASGPYEGPSTELPESLQNLEYVQYRDIYFRPDSAVWKGGNLPFLVEFFHRGFYFKEKIDVAIVDGGTARHVVYEPRLFGFGKLVPRPLPTEDIGFAGMRLATRLGRDDDNFGEFLVFQGASYFRSLGIGETYGISARGLAVKTASPDGEEFPLFREFWIEEPKPESTEIVVHALLDSPSVAGAYRFDVSPRDGTLVAVDASLFFRSDVSQVGIAPLTSMYFFGPNDRQGVDDYRGSVHDSDGLSIWRATGESLWRPLANPRELRISVFADDNPRGFGLLQRARDFASYGDLGARFERHPNLWVEPKGAWGAGSVRLIEIPIQDETHDNIVAFWTPQEPVKAGHELRVAYSLLWSLQPPLETGLMPVLTTRIGLGGEPGGDRPADLRRVVIEFGPPGPNVNREQMPEVVIECHNGECSPSVLRTNDVSGGFQVAFDARLGGEPVELRCYLAQDGKPVSETWLYRLDNT